MEEWGREKFLGTFEEKSIKLNNSVVPPLLDDFLRKYFLQ